MDLFSNRQLFFKHLAQTSPEPIALEMVKAEGCYLYDASGKAYIDAISGFSVANIGHSQPEVVKAIQEQAAAYTHLIVYGEFIQQPQVAYAQLLASILPNSLSTVYFTNSGAEATEGAMKLAKRLTGRTEMIACKNSYHGSTQGALSVMGDEYWRQAYRPLLPDIRHEDYHSASLIASITEKTACVIIEPVQAESGVRPAAASWLTAVRTRCNEVGALLIFDEIQSGFGRTGQLFAFEHSGVVPDILLLGKALGGGMPLGAFIASYDAMQSLTDQPVLGHITTFGGHPVSCAAGKAALELLLQKQWWKDAEEKGQLLFSLIKHPAVQCHSQIGLWGSLILPSSEFCKQVAKACIQRGVITDWFLFAPESIRLAPPLCIDEPTLRTLAFVVQDAIAEVASKH